MIPLFKPMLGDEELAQIRQAFEKGWITIGPKTKEFEDAFAQYVGVKHAIAVNSGTAALHLAVMGMNVEGGEVLSTAMTFIATNHAIAYNDATPVFVDIEPDTLNVSIDDMKKKITPRTKAIIVVHFGGHPCDMDAIWELAKAHNIPVIEDAAHAVGSKYKGKRIGGLQSAATCFSFHAVKNMTTGDGGMITTNDDKLAERLRKLRWCGIDKDTWLRTSGDKKYSWNYTIEEVGYKYHMNDIQASIGGVQLKRLEGFNQSRRNIYGWYKEAFKGVSDVQIPVEKSYAECAFHNYVIKTEQRDALSDYLQSKGIGTGVHYLPSHLQPCYKHLKADIPVTDQVWRKLLTLPMFPEMTQEQVRTVAREVAAFKAQSLAAK